MAEERKSAGRLHEGTAVRSEDEARYTLPMPRHGKWTLPPSRRTEYRAKDGGRNRAHQAGRDETRAVHAEGKGGTSVHSRANLREPRDAKRGSRAGPAHPPY
jgi:hypothetical protein